jgi:predicted RNase H-like HicB family nuclease
MPRVLIQSDRLTDNTLVYLARDYNQPSLMAHGSTPDEAEANLEDARALHGMIVARRSQEESAIAYPTSQAVKIVFAPRENATVTHAS